MLFENIHAMVEGVGLHTHFGNLHTPQQNRPSLVCDLVEEFRAPVVDSLVAYLINSNIFTPEDFTPPDERGGVYLHPDALKKGSDSEVVIRFNALLAGGCSRG
jgi:CRISPR-associated protein Cas1